MINIGLLRLSHWDWPKVGRGAAKQQLKKIVTHSRANAAMFEAAWKLDTKHFGNPPNGNSLHVFPISPYFSSCFAYCFPSFLGYFPCFSWCFSRFPILGLTLHRPSNWGVDYPWEYLFCWWATLDITVRITVSIAPCNLD